MSKLLLSVSFSVTVDSVGVCESALHKQTQRVKSNWKCFTFGQSDTQHDGKQSLYKRSPFYCSASWKGQQNFFRELCALLLRPGPAQEKRL